MARPSIVDPRESREVFRANCVDNSALEDFSVIFRQTPKLSTGAHFGSRLVEMSVKGQLGGTWERTFAPEGLLVDLTVSKAAIAR